MAVRHEDVGLRTARNTPPSVSIKATITRVPIGSPTIGAAESTPTRGTSSIPVDAIAGGRRRDAANQLIPTRADHHALDALAQSRRPMDMTIQGWSMRRF